MDIFDAFDKDDAHFRAYEDCENYVEEEGDLCERHIDENLREEQEQECKRRWQKSEFRASALQGDRMKNINCTSCGSNHIKEFDSFNFIYICDSCGSKFAGEGFTVQANDVEGELTGVKLNRVTDDLRVSVKVNNVERGGKVVGISIGNL